MYSAVLIKYRDLIGSSPKRKWDRVTPPDFFASYSKYPCAYFLVLSLMILIAFLFAPTVPSPPIPQNLQRTIDSGAVSITSDTGRDVFVISSVIPTVKLFFGSSFFKLSKTSLAIVGVNCF